MSQTEALKQFRQRSAEYKKKWRDFSADSSQDASIKIGFASSFTPNTMIPFLGGYLLEAGLKPSIDPGHYNQIFQACLNHKDYFSDQCDTIIILWRLEDLVLEEILAHSQGDMAASQRAMDKVSMLLSAIAELRANFNGTIIASLPPYPTGVPAYPTHLDNVQGMGRMHRSLTAFFAEKILGIKGVLPFDCDALQRDFGLSAAHDSRQWYLYRQPFSELFLAEMGRSLGRIIVARRQPPKKCIVLDCDSTLWGGIVGEDGVGGIKIGDDFPGSAFRDFQRLLLHWRQQGVLLALASKNNEADVWEVFEKHSGMVLKREHISAWQINWNPKAENIPLIAKTLNIGIDSLVFIDDNPMEVGYMRAARPEVTTIHIPEEPADILNVMQALTCFDRLEITQEDRQRADMMRSEQVRENLGSGLSKEEFFKALELNVDFFQAESSDLDRITQLINKTNQFNLTTVRRTLDEVRALSDSMEYRVFGLRVSDKFGEYGLTGSVIVHLLEDGKRWMLDTFLLSCRVLGRGVESALINALSKLAKEEGAMELVGSYIPTAKNALAATFFPDNGFVIQDDGRWKLELV
ncbi:hypothetical protein GALL_253320 [mine drainage metagenome]|uniref:Uncharacterized protein n=1 Tax=mine drainage metagenome TaxID=410659 RepID=A0A1J5RA93_9ZZZZ